LRLSHLKGATPPDIPKESLKGVTNLTINPQTGGALLEFDPDVLSIATIADIVDNIDPQAAEVLRNPHLLKPRTIFASPIPTLEQCPAPPPEPPATLLASKGSSNRPRGSAKATSELINLGVGFLTTALTGFFSSRKFHVQCGAFMGLMLVGHVWKYRKRLRPIHQMSLAEIFGWPQFSWPHHGHHDGPHMVPNFDPQADEDDWLPLEAPSEANAAAKDDSQMAQKSANKPTPELARDLTGDLAGDSHLTDAKADEENLKSGSSPTLN
jgi:hypothetical protein